MKTSKRWANSLPGQQAAGGRYGRLGFTGAAGGEKRRGNPTQPRNAAGRFVSR